MKVKKIIVGITGGIAAYKAAELVRLFVKADMFVQVAMTLNASRFVTPLTFEALSGNNVINDIFGREAGAMDHISWGQEADLIIIAPATANFVAKLANGIGDDFLSTMILAATSKVLVCPSMNSRMLANPAVQDNLSLLKKRGMTVMEPGEGQLACRTKGPGRLPEPVEILEQAMVLLSKSDLLGLKILVTAGATVEAIDPVRHITNRSTGKMGYALARAAVRRGADVTLVSGPTALMPPLGAGYIGIKTAEEMRKAVLENIADCDVIIKAAAVSDYRPREKAVHKIKKGADSLSVEMIKNPDILAELGNLKKKHPCVLVGFAAETEDIIANAEKKIKAKNLDMIVVNDVSRNDAGFATDTNIVKIISKESFVEELPLMTKDKVADLILDRVKPLTKQ